MHINFGKRPPLYSQSIPPNPFLVLVKFWSRKSMAMKRSHENSYCAVYILTKGHSFSTYEKIAKKITFLTP